MIVREVQISIDTDDGLEDGDMISNSSCEGGNPIMIFYITKLTFIFSQSNLFLCFGFVPSNYLSLNIAIVWD